MILRTYLNFFLTFKQNIIIKFIHINVIFAQLFFKSLMHLNTIISYYSQYQLNQIDYKKTSNFIMFSTTFPDNIVAVIDKTEIKIT